MFATATLFAKETVKLGVILPLTGENEAIGQECRVGLKILQDELKAKETAFDYQFIVEDDQMLPKQTAMAAQKLLKVDKVDALFPTYSTGGNVAKPFAEKAKIPMVAIGASDPTVANGSYCFTNAAKVDKQAVMFLETARELGYKRMAMLSVIQQGANAIRGAVLKHAKDYGIEIVSDEHFIPGERDFRTLWLRIKETNPDLIFEQALDPEFGIMLRHKKQMGLNIPVATVEWFAANNDLALANGAWQVGSAWAVSRTGFDKRVSVIDFKIKNFLNAAYTYDSVRIVVNAFEAWAKDHKTGRPTSRGIAALIHKLPYDGALGKSDIDGKGIIDSEVGLWIVGNGELKPIDLQELKAKLGK